MRCEIQIKTPLDSKFVLMWIYKCRIHFKAKPNQLLIVSQRNHQTIPSNCWKNGESCEWRVFTFSAIRRFRLHFHLGDFLFLNCIYIAVEKKKMVWNWILARAVKKRILLWKWQFWINPSSIALANSYGMLYAFWPKSGAKNPLKRFYFRIYVVYYRVWHFASQHCNIVVWVGWLTDWLACICHRVWGCVCVSMCVCLCIHCVNVGVLWLYRIDWARIYFMAIGYVINILVNTCTLAEYYFIKEYIGWVIVLDFFFDYYTAKCELSVAHVVYSSFYNHQLHCTLNFVYTKTHTHRMVGWLVAWLVRWLNCLFIRSFATPPNHKYLTRLKYMKMYHPHGKCSNLDIRCVCMFPVYS